MGGIDLNLASNRCFGVPVVFLLIGIVSPYEKIFYVSGIVLSGEKKSSYALKENPR